MKIGIIGGGQLGRMLALAGKNMGFEFGFLASDNPTIHGLGKVFSNIQELDNFTDVITYESENTDLDIFNNVKTPVYPPISALKITQNRKLEKQLFQNLNIPCANFEITNDIKNIQLTTPVIAKTTTSGYDGKGQFVLKTQEDIKNIDKNLENAEFILEEMIDFDYEVSLIGCYGKNSVEYYPLTKNTHNNGILIESEVIDSSLFTNGKKYLDLVAKEFNYNGILTMEFFVKDNQLIANEIAPRVHNSGHWTMDASITSQFENHIRAICGLEIGVAEATTNQVKMQNIIGEIPDIKNILTPNSKVHLYEKEPRNGRKLGHINILRNL